jgi:alkylhydroperoxidase family enzyme
MTTYPIHTVDTAPEGSKPALQGLQNAFGLVPNLAATMANAPALVSTFVAAFGQFQGTAFSGGERQVLLLTNAVTNRSSWPVAFHSTMALKEGIAPAEVEAIRHGELPADPRLAALSAITRQLIERRGHLIETEIKDFIAAGFDENELLQVIVGLAISTTANYTSNIADPPLEAPFQAQAWDSNR